MTARAQDEAEHDRAGGGEGEDDVLELAPACAHVVRLEAHLVDEGRDVRDELLQRLLVQAARPQVDAVRLGVEDAERHGAGASADDELGLVAEGGLGAGEGIEPDDVRCGIGQRELAPCGACRRAGRHTGRP